jgi:hypothetical protein
MAVLLFFPKCFLCDSFSICRFLYLSWCLVCSKYSIKGADAEASTKCCHVGQHNPHAQHTGVPCDLYFQSPGANQHRQGSKVLLLTYLQMGDSSPTLCLKACVIHFSHHHGVVPPHTITTRKVSIVQAGILKEITLISLIILYCCNYSILLLVLLDFSS